LENIAVSEAKPDDVIGHVPCFNDVIIHVLHSKGAIRFSSR
jgi:hypothetical protein